MKVTRIVLIFAFVFSFVSITVAQVKEISLEDYTANWRKAWEKSRSVNRRETQVVKTFKDGLLHLNDEWVYEYVLPDRIRYINTVTFNGKTKRIEQINIGEMKYCKKDSGPWEIVKGYCIGGSGSGGPSNIVSRKFTVESTENKGERLFREYTVYKNMHSPNKDSEGNSFSEEVFVVDNEGRFVRQTSRSGLVETKAAHREQSQTFEYISNLKIEAPIK